MVFVTIIIIGDQYIIISISLVNSSHYSLDLSIYVDIVALIFLITVTLISIRVFNFRFRYINSTIDFSRFHILLLIFVIRIFVLILRNNIFIILVGWDGLGVTSYLLVIYYGNNKACNSGIITVITNRFGDIMIFLSLGLLFIAGITPIVFRDELSQSSLLFIFAVITAAITKRAQIPFSSWLPAAIAAPTPVSSLVHSSTLVTAGVYLLIRHFYMIENMYFIVYFIGLVTITTARFTAIVESDIKKMVALSTLRQLGIIFMAIGLSWSDIAFIHLIIHAFFKAIIFISTGNLIHFSRGYQAISITGGLLWSSPVNSSGIIVASFSLIGSPFAAAFYSKEPIMEISLLYLDRTFLGFITWLGVVFTIVYSTRFLVITIGVVYKRESLNHVREDRPLDFIGVLVLFVPAFAGGAVISIIFIEYPTSIGYSRIYKLFVAATFISRLVLSFAYTSLWERKTYPVCSFISLSGLNIIRSKLWTHPALNVRSILNRYNFDYNYSILTVFINSKGGINYGLNSISNLLYIIIPLIFFLLVIVYTTLF